MEPKVVVKSLSRGNRRAIIAIGVVMLLFVGWFFTAQELKLRRFRPVQATVRDTYVSRRTSDDPYTYSPVIEYTFKLGPQGYRGTRVTPIPVWDADRGVAQDVLLRYHVGQVVTAHYNPDDPEDSFLEAKRSLLPVWFALTVIVVGAVALFGRIVWPRL